MGPSSSPDKSPPSKDVRGACHEDLDGYWAKQGRISVDLGVVGSALPGTYLAAQPLLRALRRRAGSGLGD
jgi:hypothetical protein